MKQKNFIVESYVSNDDYVFIVREPVDNNQWQARLVTHDTTVLAEFFGAL